MKKIFLPGLALYGILAGWGLFLDSGLKSPFLYPWIAGYLFLVFSVSYHILFSKERPPVFPIIVLGVLQLNFLVQITGGIHSSLWPIYFLFAALVAALTPARLTFAAIVLILGIEGSNRFLSGQGTSEKWPVYAGFALSLFGVAAAISYLMNRTRREAKQLKAAHESLLSHANAVDPLSREPRIAALTREARQASNISAAIQREDAFAGLLNMIYGFVPAHTYALFMKETRDKGDVFILRAMKSDGAGRYTSPLGTVLNPADDHGPLSACARDNRPRYLADIDRAPGNLRYYSRPVAIKSLLTMPVVDHDETVGILAVDSIENGAFSLETQDMLLRFTPFFVQIIEKIRVSQELDVRASTFAGLHRLSAVLGSSLDLDEILNRLATEINAIVPYDFCVFAQYEDRDQTVSIVHQSGDVSFTIRGPSLIGKIASFVTGDGNDKGPESDRRFPVERGTLLNQMLNHWEQGRVAPYHFSDLSGKIVSGLLDTTERLNRQLLSLSCWPLVTGERFIGVFFLGSLRLNAFSEYHRSFLDTLLNQVAMVMANIRLHQQVQNLAHTDGLTGLLNHRTFMDKLDEEFKRLDRAEEQHFSLLLLDIDFFKKVNDEYGHPVGDAALKTIAGVIRETARGIDFVARYGGEEFAVGMVGADSDGAQKMAERIRKAVEKTTITVGQTSLRRTVSIGVASYFHGCSRKETLIERTDQALYRAKHSGRNRCCLFNDVDDAETTITG